MAYNNKLAYASQDADGVVQDIKGYKPNGYNGDFGIVAPNIYFKGDFEEELATQTFYDVPAPMASMEKVDAEKGQQKGYKNLSFKSVNLPSEQTASKTSNPFFTILQHHDIILCCGKWLCMCGYGGAVYPKPRDGYTSK